MYDRILTEETAVVKKLYSLARRFTRLSQTEPVDVAPVIMEEAPKVVETKTAPPSTASIFPGTIYPVPSALTSASSAAEGLLPHYLYNMRAIAEYWRPIAGSLEPIAEFRQLDRRVMILCSSRTGSEYLSYLLEDFGLKIYESFNVVMDVHTRRIPRGMPSLRDYVLAMIRECTTAGLFGVKGTTESALPLFLYGEWPKYAREWKIIRIQRRNIVRQAISLLIAEKTQAWHPGQVPKREVADSEYRFMEVLNAIERIVDVNNHVERIVALLGVDAMSVYYEDLRADARAVTDAVGRHLELDRTSTKALEGHGSTRPQPTIRSTDLNKIWENRFHEDLAAYNSSTGLRTVAA